MRRQERCPPGVITFWENADREGSTEHPIERELRAQMQALAHYQQLIEAADATADWDALDGAAQLYDEEVRRVEALRGALHRQRSSGA